MGALCCAHEVSANIRHNISSIIDVHPTTIDSQSAESEVPEAERVIRNFEVECPFTKLNASDFAEILTEESMQNKLSTFQLKKVFKRVSIKKSCLEDPDAPLFRLLYSLREGKLYNYSKLLVTGLLLSSSKPFEKSALIFEHFTINSNHLLGRNEVHNLLSTVFEVSVNCIPIIALDEETGHGLSETDLVSYQKLLNSYKKDFVNEHLRKITDNDSFVTKHEFLSIIMDFRSILYSYEIREYILRLYNNQ